MTLDKVTNRLATASCPQTYTVAFIAGTEPKETCDQAAGDHRGFFTKIFGLGLARGCAATSDDQWRGSAGTGRTSSPRRQTASLLRASSLQPKKKRGFFSRLFGRGDNEAQQQPQQPQQQPQNNGTDNSEKGNNPGPN